MITRIRDLREDSDMTQTEVAAHLHIRQNTYCQYEIGRRQLPLTCLVSLARLYGTSTDYILGLTDQRRPYPPKRGRVVMPDTKE